MHERPLHILQTCFSRSWGGLELQALEVSARLAARGHRLTLAVPRGSRLAAEAAAAGVPVLALGVTGYFHPAAVAAIAAFLRRERVDVVHCQHSRDLATLVPALRLAGSSAPLLLSKRVGSYLMKRDLLHRFTYARVDRVLAISEVIRRNVVATTPAREDQVVTLHDAVDLDRFAPRPEARARVRREFGYGEETLVVGFMGRFSPGKGHEEFLAAAALLAPAHPSAHFLVVGEASRGEEAYAATVRSRPDALALGDRLRFAGFRSDAPDVLAALDLFAFPSHAEAFGVVLIEAMATGLAAVSTNCDGVLDIVVDGETGILVPPRDAPALAAGLARLAQDPGLRAAMGAAGRRRVAAMFDQRRQTDAIVAHYRELLAARRAP